MTAPRAADRRVFIIGLDGATFDLIEPWADEGLLPNLKAIMDTGAWAPLESTLPCNSAPAWTSMMTGNGPGKHGIYHFVRLGHHASDWHFYTAAMCRTPYLWGLASEAGRRVGVVNVPMTHPVLPVNGFLIPGLPAGIEDMDPALYQELCSELGAYDVEAPLADVFAMRSDADRHAVFRAVCRADRTRCHAVRYLMDSRPWELFIAVFVATDRLQHRFWQFMDRDHPHYDAADASGEIGDYIRRGYQLLDGIVGRLRAALPPETNLLVTSDHGCGPAPARRLDMNRLLARLGYLTFAAPGGEGGPWLRFLRRSRQLLRQRVPTAWRHALRHWLADLNEQTAGHSVLADIDWSATRLYGDRVYEGASTVWVNQQGREPSGIVPPGEPSERLLAEVRERLMAVRDPETDEPIVRDILTHEELYPGPEANAGPDLIVRWRDDRFRTPIPYPEAWADPRAFVQDVPAEESARTHSGEHRPYGVLLAVGPDIRPASRLDGYHLTDVTPTALALLGIPIPEGLDGRVMHETLTDAFLAANPIVTTERAATETAGADGYSAEEEEKVAQRLRELGYLG